VGNKEYLSHSLLILHGILRLLLFLWKDQNQLTTKKRDGMEKVFMHGLANMEIIKRKRLWSHFLNFLLVARGASTQQPERRTTPPAPRQCLAHHSFYLINF
jgi:hypothetical protein